MDTLDTIRPTPAPGRVVGHFAHEINNRLAAAVGNLELAVERCTDLDMRDTLLRPALRTVLGGVDLTQRLVAASAHRSLRPVPLEPAALLEAVVTLAGRALGPRHVIRWRVEAGAGPIRVDQAAADVALLHLIHNARDAMPDGGAIALAVAGEPGDGTAGNPGWTRFSVTDTGSGMPPDVAARVLEPFFTTKPPPSCGLGLAVVDGFVRQSRGRLRLDTVPGRGTTVHLLFPQVLSGQAGG